MEVTFLYDIGDVVMLRPMSGSNTDYTAGITSYEGKVNVPQYRITQRRYVEEISGQGKVGYSGDMIGEIGKRVALEESTIIKVDEYLAKKAIIDSTKPQKQKASVSRAGQVGQVISPAVVDQFRQLYGTATSTSSINPQNALNLQEVKLMDDQMQMQEQVMKAKMAMERERWMAMNRLGNITNKNDCPY